MYVFISQPIDNQSMLLPQDLPTYDHDGEVQWVVAEFGEV